MTNTCTHPDVNGIMRDGEPTGDGRCADCDATLPGYMAAINAVETTEDLERVVHSFATYSPDDYATWILGTVRVTSGRDVDPLRQARRHPAGIAVHYRQDGAWTPCRADIAETFVPLPGSTLPRSYVNEADYLP